MTEQLLTVVWFSGTSVLEQLRLDITLILPAHRFVVCYCVCTCIFIASQLVFLFYKMERNLQNPNDGSVNKSNPDTYGSR